MEFYSKYCQLNKGKVRCLSVCQFCWHKGSLSFRICMHVLVTTSCLTSFLSCFMRRKNLIWNVLVNYFKCVMRYTCFRFGFSHFIKIIPCKGSVKTRLSITSIYNQKRFCNITVALVEDNTLTLKYGLMRGNFTVIFLII